MAAQPRWAGYAWAFAATVACTAIGLAMRPRFDLVNVAMVYLVAVVLVALRCSRGAAALTAVLCVATFDFLFVPPEGTFTVDDIQYLFTFAIMLGVALVISGLTGDVRRQARAQAQLEIAAETERIRSALLASISHDLRTPLAVMSGASSSLAEKGDRMDEEERRALARSIFDQARDMSEHVAKVLQMTRLDSGTIALERDWASFAEIAGSALRKLAGRLASHRVLVEIPRELPMLRVDAPLVEQAVANLLENAAKHTPAGTVVRLRAIDRGGEVEVAVEDYGGGIADADLERVFGKFQRGTAEPTVGGIGLGLSICRAIVRLHGGRAWAERIAEGGTAFRFTLPIERMPAVPAEATATP
jgi:two-component system sensor histidine kinase KdpD